MKKLFVFVLAVVMLISAMPFAALAADGGRSQDFSDVLENDYKIEFGDDDWRYYDEYYYYNYTGDRDHGILTNSVTIALTDDFMETGAEITAEWFPEIKDEIIEIELLYNIKTCTIVLEERYEPGNEPVYTEEHIDHFVSILRYVSTFSFVKWVWPNFRATMHEDDPSYDGEFDYKILFGYDDWKYYDEYFYYNYTEDREKGFITDCVLIDLTDEFMESGEEITAEWFPEIKDEIIEVKLLYAINSCTIVLEERYDRDEDGNRPEYTKEHIDHYISILRYVSTFSFVERVNPNFITKMYPDPIEPDPSDSETNDPETTEPETTESTETEGVGTVTENDNNNNNGNGLNNHQTGDMFFVYLCGFLLAAGVISVLTAGIIKKKSNK